MSQNGLAAYVRAAQRGNLGGFEALVQRFQDMALNYSQTLLGDSHLAEDAAQDAFAQAYTRLGQLQNPEAFPGWFRQIVYSCCMRYRQRRKEGVVEFETAAPVVDPNPLPDTALADKERAVLLNKALASLEEAEKNVLMLHYIQQYTLREMAAFLAVSTTTIKNRLRSAKEKMHGRLLTMDHLKNNKVSEYFKRTTPEAQGMDSSYLLRMCQHLDEVEEDFHSVLILRHGHIVFEAYYDPYQKETKHMLAGATIAFTSALMGIALAQGYIPDVEARVLDFFPEHRFAHTDARKKSMKIKDLLSMSSGLDWTSSWTKENPEWCMFQVDDPAQYILDRPMAHEPGKVWNYSGGDAQLLAIILQKLTGKKVFDYAQEHLFDPLNYTNLYWEQYIDGVNLGCAGLYMSPRDMAKFGYLYLKGGKLAGKRIIPAQWVEASFAARAESVANSALGFGYNWWHVPELNLYRAWGYGGQQIAVLPDRDMVVVFTGGIKDNIAYPLHHRLYRDFIIPAVKSSQALPENPKVHSQLLDWMGRIGKEPVAKGVGDVPLTAQRIAGKRYELRQNSFGFNWFTLEFPAGKEIATMDCDLRFGEFVGKFPLGLDGVYRVTPIKDYWTSLAFKASWQDETTFVIDLLNVVLGYRYKFSMRFYNEYVEIDGESVIEQHLSEKIHGKQQ